MTGGRVSRGNSSRYSSAASLRSVRLNPARSHRGGCHDRLVSTVGDMIKTSSHLDHKSCLRISETKTHGHCPRDHIENQTEACRTRPVLESEKADRIDCWPRFFAEAPPAFLH